MPNFRVTWDGGITFHYIDYPLTEDLIRELQRSGAIVHELAPGRFQGQQGQHVRRQGQFQGQVHGLGYGQVQGQVGPVVGHVSAPLIALRAALPVPQIVTTIDLNFVQRAQISQSPMNLQLFSGIQIPNPSVILLAPPATQTPNTPPIRCQCGFSIKSKKSSCQFKRRVFNCFQTAIMNTRFKMGLPVSLQEKLMFAKDFKVTIKQVITWFGKRSRRK
ncbi:hypothetical protein B9Z55_007504 [Caenorhabditis nigoni]|uniref:Homeobox domain-containing protein n=1 Tax=Caenorhabditis nigoni TaxID=1611254 RepID=A0A2G5V9Y3_9PELO|nr:hypothetical protein B9Z55_007504 [Caenorhabditis nigoni]